MEWKRQQDEENNDNKFDPLTVSGRQTPGKQTNVLPSISINSAS